MTTFILTNKERKLSPIALLVSFRGKKYKKSIGESVSPKLWSAAKKRVKVSAGDTDASLINEKIELWERAAKLTISHFKEVLYIPETKEFFSVLERYSDDTGKLLIFEDIDMDFYRSFLSWVFGHGYSANYFGSTIKILKVVVNEARHVDHLHENDEVNGKNFAAPQKEADNIYLTIDELLCMHRLDISPELIRREYPELPANKVAPRIRAYSKARDMFLIGAFTGLRVSDFSRLKGQNIGETITIKTKKTGVKVVIPVHWVVREILNSGYDFSPMPDQKINTYIKEVARLAGINGEVVFNRSVGGKELECTARKYELVTTHTARRSFATNAYKAGVPTIAIMKITGHTRETTFLKYIKISEEENAEMLKTHSFFRK